MIIKNHLRKIVPQKFSVGDFIIMDTHPEWGVYQVIEVDDWYTIRSRAGERVLFETEAIECWSISTGG